MGIAESAEVLRRHRVTVEDFYRMGTAGILALDERLELIEGEMIDMAPIGTRHSSTVMRLTRRLGDAAVGRAILSVQGPLRLGRHSEPVPDLMLLRPSADFYAQEHPVAADALLVIEVADSSARYDREIKVPLYARHGVTELWIIDLDNRVARFFRGPVGDHYAEASTSEAPGAVPVAALPGVTIDLTDLLA